ncbi:MAG: hypothetical protein ACLS3M_08395 [Collinsella sp.]
MGHATQSAGGFLPEFHTDFVFAFLSRPLASAAPFAAVPTCCSSSDDPRCL